MVALVVAAAAAVVATVVVAVEFDILVPICRLALPVAARVENTENSNSSCTVASNIFSYVCM